MRKVVLFIGVFLTVEVSAQKAIENRIDNAVSLFFEKFQPETITIHLSAETFFTGETIWYSAYLHNQPYSANLLSSIAYVELRSGQDILCRQKLKLIDGVAAGDFLLPKNLTSGNYQIRGYTSWMKNLGDSNYFEQSIAIINPDNPGNIQSTSAGSIKEDSNVFKFVDTGDDVSILVTYSQQCIVAILNNGNLFLLKTLSRDSVHQLKIQKSQLINNVLQVGLFDKTGTLLTERSFVCSTDVMVSTNKFKYSPRDRIDIVIQDKDQQALTALYSVTVQKKQHTDGYSYPQVALWDQVMHSDDRDIQWSKEKIIYPKSQNTIEPIAMNIPQHLVSGAVNSSANVNPAMIENLTRNKLITQVSESYGIVESVMKSSAHQLPSDVTYFPKDFAALPTLEDFFIEVVPQVKVKKTKGIKGIRVRNNEVTNKLHYFKENPMLVVDGVRKDDPEEMLKLDPQDVESIQITYKLGTLNSSGIARYADNGILAIYTKAGSKRPTDNLIYDGFYVSSTFTAPTYGRSNSSKDVVPDLRKHMYWNPHSKGTGKTSLSFYLSDDVGEFTIKVRGQRSDGTIILYETAVEVVMN
jgi:hypothetical protein